MSNLVIVLDASGSMSEMGKSQLQRNLCRYASQLQTFGMGSCQDIKAQYFKWEREVAEICVDSDGEISSLVFEGTSSLTALSEFLSRTAEGRERSRILVLSDGNFSSSDVRSFQSKRKTLPGLIVRTVAVGADADLRKLKWISSNDSVHRSENIATAITDAAFGYDECTPPPEYLSQIALSEQLDLEEAWDA